MMRRWWWWLERRWCGPSAHLSALGHLLRGHRVRWWGMVDLWMGCWGDVTCEGCPDYPESSGILFWTRESRLLWACTTRLCGWLGHPELRHPSRSLGWDEPTHQPLLEPILDQWYCVRCGADVHPPTAEGGV